MPLYMDIHHKINGLTAEAIKGAHEQDLYPAWPTFRPRSSVRI